MRKYRLHSVPLLLGLASCGLFTILISFTACRPEVELLAAKGDEPLDISQYKDQVYIYASSGAQDISISFRYRKNLKVEDQNNLPEWISVDAAEKDGKASIVRVRLKENPAPESRSAGFTVKCNNAETIVCITQDEARVIEPLNRISVIGQDGGTLLLSVNTNTSIDNVVIDSEWIKSTKSLSKTTFAFIVENNTGEGARESRILLQSGDIKANMHVIQKGARPLFQGDTGIITIPYYENAFDIYTENPIQASATKTETEWISFEDKQYEHIVSASVSFNTTGNKRAVTLPLTDTPLSVIQEGTDIAVIKITHHANVFTVPEMEGYAMRVVYDWGDGTIETDPVPGMQHKYKDAKERIITCTAYGTSAINIKEITGISNLNLTEWLK